jgi:membrane associated rhomboid family serine protease
MGGLVPLTDASRRPAHVPVVTACIILVNAFVFLLELLYGDTFVMRWSAIPAQIVSGHHWITILTAMFMHGSWSHIIGNMVFLWAFAPEIEDAMGRGRYLVFYLVGGLVAMLAQVLADPHSTVPNLGASGAIAAVMGAFLVTYPRDRIRSLLFIFVFVRITYIPAGLLIGDLVRHSTRPRGRRGSGADRRSGIPGARWRLPLRSRHRASVRRSESNRLATKHGLVSLNNCFLWNHLPPNSQRNVTTCANP